MKIQIPEHIKGREATIKYLLENQHEIIALKKMETKIIVKSLDVVPSMPIISKSYTTTNKDTDTTL